jgi:hypothetical protein
MIVSGTLHHRISGAGARFTWEAAGDGRVGADPSLATDCHGLP